jgi:tellurite resistance protein TerC
VDQGSAESDHQAAQHDRRQDAPEHKSADRFTGFMRKHMRVTDELDGQNFTTRRPDPKSTSAMASGVSHSTGLPVFGSGRRVVKFWPSSSSVTRTSNIFAILGLRALYFALAAMVDRFAYLKTALALMTGASAAPRVRHRL